ncbi:ComF family protein [Streptomyces sp. H10-C2]|uniref:ComF family protein n=1 Tax=unclassified Streptomyces TaxID=2593676 RepID=UPI0024B96EE4|nr:MULTISPECIES: ComF family protein [unclassified Streptomyces]MDJ0345734.1 ComF family protein [Streptomyces sp. PH10-H1]MDJ0374573.1 ComF family protein [Streptomyces sp. H10-C2]
MPGWWREIAGLVLPADCAGCGRPRMALCGECGELLGSLDGAAVRRVRPEPAPGGLPDVYAAGTYADEIRAVVLAHKERGAMGLARPLGAALAGAVLRVGVVGAVLLVPVPSARRTVAARGHDATRRIALCAARELRRTGKPARVAAVLRQRRAVADQARLSGRERLENLSGAVVATGGGRRLLAVAPVVLVDDLMTTGASLAAAAGAVEEAGGRIAGAAVVAGPMETELCPETHRCS